MEKAFPDVLAIDQKIAEERAKFVNGLLGYFSVTRRRNSCCLKGNFDGNYAMPCVTHK